MKILFTEKDIKMMDLWFGLTENSEFVGIFDTKKQLAKHKANIGDFAIIKGYQYRLSKQPYYKTKNWIKTQFLIISDNKGDNK